MIMPKDTLGFIGRDNLLTSSGVFTDCADKYVLIAISQKVLSLRQVILK